MIKTYLLINAIAYLFLAIVCLVNPSGTASSQGYGFLNNSGRVEYLVIYAGMQFGFAAFFALAAFYPQLGLAALAFAVCTYAFIMITRTISALVYGNVLKMTYIVGGLEYALGIWGIILLAGELKKLA